MKPEAPSDTLRLNLGCGDRPVRGFVNIDVHPAADLNLDLRAGMPFERSTIAAIRSEHFIEHLEFFEAAAHLRECRRVLQPGGILRVATPDLRLLAQTYLAGRTEMAWTRDFGYDWIESGAELVNTAMREWGHKWLFDETELRRLAALAGLECIGAFEGGRSADPALAGLDYRAESLTLEFRKPTRASLGSDTLVSILIPAYNPRYFADALESALAQSHAPIEVVVADDSPDGAISKFVRSRTGGDERVRCLRNRPAQGPVMNYEFCLRQARSDVVKFLNDDDMLEPHCVERMLACLQADPDATLVTSYRRLIDERGEPQADRPFNRSPFDADVRVPGDLALHYLCATRENFIGEPTSTLFRRSDLLRAYGDPFRLLGHRILWNIDQVWWLRLLAQGDLIYLVEPQTRFRQHGEQAQRSEAALRRTEIMQAQIAACAQRLGTTLVSHFAAQPVPL